PCCAPRSPSPRRACARATTRARRRRCRGRASSPSASRPAPPSRGRRPRRASTPGSSVAPRKPPFSDTVGQPLGQGLWKPSLADLCLCLLDRIWGTAERCPPGPIVNQQPGGARVAAARLPDGPGVEEPAALREVDRGALVGDAAADRLAVPREGERDVAVADEDDRSGGQPEAEVRRGLAQDVVPDRVDRASVVELDPGPLGRGLEGLE